jgi:hypothetical protein
MWGSATTRYLKIESRSLLLYKITSSKPFHFLRKECVSYSSALCMDELISYRLKFPSSACLGHIYTIYHLP